MSERSAPFDSLVYALDGRAEIIVAGNSYLVREGEMIILPAKKPHSLKAEEKFKMILMIRSADIRRFGLIQRVACLLIRACISSLHN